MSTYGAVKSATCEALVPESANLENNATHVHIGGFYTCKKLQAGLPALVKKLKAAGVKVSMDPNFDATAQWTPKAIIDLLTGEGAVDLVMPSEVEACEITSKETAAEALEALLEGGVGLVVIKRGANGVLAGSGSERWEVPACTVNKVVDSNGAGDAFNAGFLRAYSEGHSIKLALQAGCASAALAVQYVGAVGMWAAGRAEVDARCETEYSDKPWWQKGIMACMAPRKM